jgi:hypothetical protein
MATPMMMNLKLLNHSYSYLVNPMMHRQLIRSLMYPVNTRPGICFAVNTLSQYMVELRHVHWTKAKHVLRSLCGIVGYGLRYVSDEEVKLQGYTNFNWEGSAVDRESTLRCFFSLGSSMISWLRRKQMSLALNTIEAEYLVDNIASHGALWLRKLLAGIFDIYLEPTLIYCDNQICVKLSENHIFHDKSKNIDIKYHYIQDMV